MIYYLIGGAVISSLFAVPFIFWAREKGAYAYSSGRARGMKNKFFTDDEIKTINTAKILPKLRKSVYWHIIHKSNDRFSFEKMLEEHSIKMQKKISNFSPDKLGNFLKKYHSLERLVANIKLIMNCVNVQNKDELRSLLLPSKSYENLIGELIVCEELSQIITVLQEYPVGRFASFDVYQGSGLVGLEYSLDEYFFKELYKSAFNKELKYFVDRLRGLHIYKSILRLKSLDFKVNEVLKILRLKRKEYIRLASLERNLLLRELSLKLPVLGEGLRRGNDVLIFLKDIFDQEKIELIRRIDSTKPLNVMPVLEVDAILAREIRKIKGAWSIVR